MRSSLRGEAPVVLYNWDINVVLQGCTGDIHMVVYMENANLKKFKSS